MYIDQHHIGTYMYLYIHMPLYFLQLNGVELPCGSILSVQLADMDYKKKQSKEQDKTKSNNNGKKMVDDVKVKVEIVEDECNKTKQLEKKNKSMVEVKADDPKPGDDAVEDNEEDDLDDFFASL